MYPTLMTGYTNDEETHKFKATLAVEALRGDKTAQEITAKHKTHPAQVTTWKRQAIHCPSVHVVNA
jgi:transposase-like protein